MVLQCLAEAEAGGWCAEPGRDTEDLVGEDAGDQEIEWDYGDRDLPTPQEEEFARALLAIHRWYDFYLCNDPDGTPWMLISRDMWTGTTLRVDFDSRGVRGGDSASGLNWDLGVRAEESRVLLEPPARFEIRAEGRSLPELAQATHEHLQRIGAELIARAEAHERQPPPSRFRAAWPRRRR